MAVAGSAGNIGIAEVLASIVQQRPAGGPSCRNRGVGGGRNALEAVDVGQCVNIDARCVERGSPYTARVARAADSAHREGVAGVGSEACHCGEGVVDSVCAASESHFPFTFTSLGSPSEGGVGLGGRSPQVPRCRAADVRTCEAVVAVGIGPCAGGNGGRGAGGEMGGHMRSRDGPTIGGIDAETALTHNSRSRSGDVAGRGVDNLNIAAGIQMHLPLV